MGQGYIYYSQKNKSSLHTLLSSFADKTTSLLVLALSLFGLIQKPTIVRAECVAYVDNSSHNKQGE